MNWGDGHTVVVVPVPEVEPFVLELTRFYDAAWVSGDPAFTHAHITILAPWATDPTQDELDVLGEVAARTPSFEFSLGSVEQFPDGTIYLPVSPDESTLRLIRDVATRFALHPPYNGAFGAVDDLVPHVTVDRLSASVTVATTRASIGDLIPVRCRADRLEVHRYAANDCRVLASFPLAD